MNATHYPAQAYSPDHGETKLSGELTITPGAVQFASPNGQVKLPLDGLSIKLGGASNRLVFFEHAQVRGWVIYTSERAVLSDPLLAQHPAARSQAANAKKTRAFGWGIAAGVLALFVALPLLLIMNLDRASAWVAPSIPAEWEHTLGESVFAQYKLGNSLLDDAEAKKALDALTHDLVKTAHTERYTFSLHINTDTELNAFALPDGTVVINAGLILAADHADEVLGVLAHELSHVRHQHGVRQIISSSGIYLIASALIGDASGVMAVVASASPLLLSQSYSRYFETEADAEGAKLMAEIHGDIGGLVSFFEKMEAEEEKRLAEITDEDAREALKATAGLLSTHPATDDRIAALKELSSRRYSRDPNREDAFRSLKARVGALISKEESSNTEAINTEKVPQANADADTENLTEATP